MTAPDPAGGRGSAADPHWLLDRRARGFDAAAVLALLLVAAWSTWSVFRGLPAVAMGPDHFQWWRSAVELAAGDPTVFCHTHRPLAYPALAAALVRQGVDAAVALRVLVLGAWVLAPVLTYLAILVLFGRGAAVLGAFLVLMDPGIAEGATISNSQALFVAALALHLGLGYLLARSLRPAAWVALGFLSGLMPLIKEQGLAVPALAAVMLVVLPERDPPGGRRAGALVRLALFLVGLALPAAVLVGRQLWLCPAETKEQIVLGDVLSLLWAEDWRTVRLTPDSWNTLVERHRADLRPGLAGLLAFKSSTLWDALGGNRSLAVAAAAALLPLASPGGRGLRLPALWTVAHLLPVAPVFILHVEKYHISFVAVPLAVLAAAGVVATARGVAHRVPAGAGPWRGIALGTIFIVGGALAAAHAGREARSPAGLLRQRLGSLAWIEYKTTHDWLAEGPGRGASIVCPSPWAVHALGQPPMGRRVMVLDEPRDLSAVAVGPPAMLVLDTTMPDLQAWLDALRADPHWVHRWDSPPSRSGVRTTIFSRPAGR